VYSLRVNSIDQLRAAPKERHIMSTIRRFLKPSLMREISLMIVPNVIAMTGP